MIPQWLGPVLMESQAPTGRAPGGKPITHRYTPPEGQGVPSREWSSDGPSLITTSVCVDCNNGWLSKLEVSAIPIVGPLVKGAPTVLDGATQHLVARWAYKTMLLFQMVRPEALRAIPQARFAEFFALRRPPTDARIWLGGNHGNAAANGSQRPRTSSPGTLGSRRT